MITAIGVGGEEMTTNLGILDIPGVRYKIRQHAIKVVYEKLGPIIW